MKFRRYEAYKDSEVLWLGKVPKGWNVVAIRRLFQIINGSTPRTDISDYWNGDIVWITPADLSEFNMGVITDSKKRVTLEGYNSCGTSIVPVNSIVISTRAPIGTIALAGIDLCTNQGCKSLVSDKHINEYFFFQLAAIKEILNMFGQGTTFLELGNDELKQIKVVVPPVSEQLQIVSFLNDEISRIDALIKEHEGLITLLKEKRSALITHAVTKGLDPNAKMRDSGVEWLGEVPEKWDIRPLFTVLYEHKVNNHGNYVTSVLSLSYGRIVNRDVTDNFGLLPESFETYQIIEKGDIILRLTDLQNDHTSLRTGLSTQTGIITSAYVCIRPENTPDFYSYLLHSYDANKLFYSFGGGVRQSMKYSDLKWVPILVPTEEERKRIVNYIDIETKKLDTLIEHAELFINLLKERCSALITAAVTGKIDVRDEVPA